MKAITNANRVINIGYLFMRGYILHIIENNGGQTPIEEPVINGDFIRSAFSVCASDDQPKKGRPFNKEMNSLLYNFKQYFEIFKENTNYQAQKSSCISYILGQACDQIEISIINNIKYHFDKHLQKYIKTHFISERQDIINKKINKTLKEYYSDMEKIRDDIYDDTLKSNECYHEWIKNNRNLVIPIAFNKEKFDTDVEKHMFKYIKCMHYMNNYLQSNNVKSYQIFPIRSSGYDKYVKINTSALIDIFYDENKEHINKIDYLKNAGNTDMQEMLWNKYFHLKGKNKYRFKAKKYSFNYEMDTDGFAVSLNFIKNDKIPDKESKKSNFRKARQLTAQNKKYMPEAEYKALLKNKEIIDNQKKENDKLLAKQKAKNQRDEFKKLTPEQQLEIKYRLNEKAEFPYIEKLLQNPIKRKLFTDDFEKGNLIFCDPGKRSILYMMASNHVNNSKKKELYMNNFGISNFNGRKIMNYTNKTRLKYTKRLKYGQLIESWKRIEQLNPTTIFKNIEIELSKLNGKSCNHSEFMKYVKKHNEFILWSNLYDFDYIKKLKWFGYLNKRKHENDLLNQISNEFAVGAFGGNDKTIKIIIGDWSNKGNIKFISTPNLSIKRKLNERFTVYLIDEHNTSCIHNKYHVKCDNLNVPVKPIGLKSIKKKPKKRKKHKEEKIKKNYRTKNKHNPNSIICDKRKIKIDSQTIVECPESLNLAKTVTNYKSLHSVLTFKHVTEELGCKVINGGCINRDKNSVLNMEQITKGLIETGERPSIFKRSTNRPVRKVKPVSEARGAHREIKVSKQKSQPIQKGELVSNYKQSTIKKAIKQITKPIKSIKKKLQSTVPLLNNDIPDKMAINQKPISKKSVTSRYAKRLNVIIS